jgi:3-hydroxymyristoyl/3-hydroxydecanoyl-(acyl carrier protein) dehydratase
LTPPNAEHAWSSAEHRFAPDHATAEGHFPGNPLIPGALLLHHALSAIGAPPPISVRVVKFLRPVRPGDMMTIRWQVQANGETVFEGRLADSGGPALVGTLGPSRG